MNRKKLYIIAGCNGAGKTTASLNFLPTILNCNEWVNADEIAKGLSYFNPESVAIAAGRLMLQRIQELLRQGDSFAIETTLATKSYRNLVKQAHELGYDVELLFFYLPSVSCALRRVAHRVRHGGHDIPRDVIVRRYYAGIKNLVEIYVHIVDKWTVFLCKGNEFEIVDCGKMGETVTFEAISGKNDKVDEPKSHFYTDQERRLVEACNNAVLKLYIESALHDDLVVMIDENNEPVWVRAREVLEKNPGLKRKGMKYTPVEVDLDEYLKDVQPWKKQTK